jgi:hypothetical protein
VQDWSDMELCEELADIDQDDDVSVSDWEASFIESVALPRSRFPRGDHVPLTPRQREKAVQIIEKYRG